MLCRYGRNRRPGRGGVIGRLKNRVNTASDAAMRLLEGSQRHDCIFTIDAMNFDEVRTSRLATGNTP